MGSVKSLILNACISLCSQQRGPAGRGQRTIARLLQEPNSVQASASRLGCSRVFTSHISTCATSDASLFVKTLERKWNLNVMQDVCQKREMHFMCPKS